MALENLQSVFNDLSKNIKDDFGGPHGQGVHGGLTNEFPSTPHYEHSVFGNISENISIGDELEDNSTAGKITLDDSGTVDYTPLVGQGTGLFGGINTFSQLLDDNINKRKFDTSPLGKNQQLGLGAYTFDTLYNTDHTAVINRPVIDTGKKDHEGNSIYINTGRVGAGDLSKLNIKGYSDSFRDGLLGGKEPYIVNEIGSKTNSIGNNRDLIPFTAALEDVSRLAKFYTSPAGLAFTTKENITNYAIGSVPNNNPLPRMFGYRDPFAKDLNTSSKLLVPPVNNPVQGNTGFLNFTNQFRDLGSQIASLRKPFTVEYSKRHTLSLPYGFLGDNFRKIKFTNPITGDEDEDRDILDRPFFKKPRFLGLGQGPGNRKLNNGSGYANTDSVSDSGVIKSVGTDALGNEAVPEDFPLASTVSVQDGDFYVRIRDLRDNTYIYFRGYVTGITENVSPSFTPINYIGRSEPVYMYERAERDLSFNLRVYPANITQQDKMYEKIEKLTSLAYPEYLPETNNNSLVRMKAPFTELYMAHIGSRVTGQFGFIKSITYTVNETGDWDALDKLPRLFDIAISYQILHRKSPSINTKFYRANTNPVEDFF